MNLSMRERRHKISVYYDNKCGYSADFCNKWKDRVRNMPSRQVAAIYQKMYEAEDIRKKGGIKGQIDIWEYMDYIKGKEQVNGN